MPIARVLYKAFIFMLAGLALLTGLITSTTGTFAASLPKTNHSPITPAHMDTRTGIHPFLMSDFRIDPLNQIPQSMDYMWGADVSSVATLRANNPNLFLSYYIPFHSDFGTFRDNNVSQRGLSYWQASHPDWVLYQCDRKTPAFQYGAPNMPLDFTNPALVNWQLQNYIIPAMQYGYSGIAADNIDFGNWYHACGIYRNGKWVQLFSGQSIDANWRAGIMTWLTQMHNALSNLSQPMALIPNLATAGLPLDGPTIRQVVSLTDGILDEGGFTSWGTHYLTGNEYAQRVRFMEYVQDQQKPYYVVNSFKSLNRAAMQWSLASYLMGKGNMAELFTSTYQGYGNLNIFPEYSAAIGSPTGAMYATQRVYWRNYSNGLALANPSGSTIKITLNNSIHYMDLYGNSVGPNVTMAPFSGLVLLVQPASGIHRSQPKHQAK